MRSLTRIALLVALVLALGSPAAFGNDKEDTPAGTWLVKVTAFPGSAFELKLQYLQSFNKDGVTTALLSTGGPPDYPETGDPRTGCMGEWKKRTRTGGMVFDVTQACLFSQEWVPSTDSPWYPDSWQELQLTLTLHPKSDTWSGPFVITAYDADGNFNWAGDGIMEATRIKLNPLP